MDGLSHIENVVTGRSPMRMFTMFSSIAALLGSGGQSNYAAANATLDARSEAHCTIGIPSVSVQWGAWLGGGMADGALAARLDRIGLGALQPNEGLSALGSLMLGFDGACGQYVDIRSVVTVNPFRWDRFLENMSSVPPLYDEFTTFQTDSVGANRITHMYCIEPDSRSSATQPVCIQYVSSMHS